MSSSAGSSSSDGHGFADLSSYKLISSSYPVEWNYEGKAIFCDCNLKSPRRCAWTDTNPGRRFYGCNLYPETKCKFLAWHDPEICERAIEIILELKRRERFLYNETRRLKNEFARLKRNVVHDVEAEIIEENMLLRAKLDALWFRMKEHVDENVLLRTELHALKLRVEEHVDENILLNAELDALKSRFKELSQISSKNHVRPNLKLVVFYLTILAIFIAFVKKGQKGNGIGVQFALPK